MDSLEPLDYGTSSTRRCIVRPIILAIALIFLAIDLAGAVTARRNATFPSQDADKMPPAMAQAQALKQPWMDFGCSIIPIGVVGLLLLPFSFRCKNAQR